MLPTGTWPKADTPVPAPPAPARRKVFVVIATDRHHCGKPLRALTGDLRHLEQETKTSRFRKFATREEAETWLESVRWRLVSISNDWVYTVTDI